MYWYDGAGRVDFDYRRGECLLDSDQAIVALENRGCRYCANEKPAIARLQLTVI
jgi:hypothetical protein